MTKKQSATNYLFTAFLQNMHLNDYSGTNDDMPDDFDKWLAELDPEKMRRYGDEFAQILINETNQ